MLPQKLWVLILYAKMLLIFFTYVYISIFKTMNISFISDHLSFKLFCASQLLNDFIFVCVINNFHTNHLWSCWKPDEFQVSGMPTLYSCTAGIRLKQDYRFKAGILRDKTMVDNLTYIPNDEILLIWKLEPTN